MAAGRSRAWARLMTEPSQLVEALGLDSYEWAPEGGFTSGAKAAAYGFGEGSPGLEVLAVTLAAGTPDGAIADLWRARQNKQALPLLFLGITDGAPDQLRICGPAEADLQVRTLAAETTMALVREALKEPTPQASARYLKSRLPIAGDDGFLGIRNSGLFSDHTLRDRVRARKDWDKANDAGRDFAGLEGKELVEALGFQVDDGKGDLRILRTKDGAAARAVAVFLDRDEEYVEVAGRFMEASPRDEAFAKARQDNLPFVVITRGPEIRLYATSSRPGVGRKEAAETYIEANMSQLGSDEFGFVPLIFSARALQDDGSFDEILRTSRDYSADLSARLRERVYKEVVPGLAIAIAEQSRKNDEDSGLDLELIYEQGMLLLFRMLFIAYAEDRYLLPYRENEHYRANSLKALAQELTDRAYEEISFDGEGTKNLWSRVANVCEAVDRGNHGWGVPAYNGGLFSTTASPAAEALASIVLTDEAFGPPLTALLVEPGDPPGPVDFRSLSVRDFGTIYEGLLESSLSIASGDLAIDKDEFFVPADEGAETAVKQGEVYHHNRSGSRKSSGSYFTKEFAVEHLLDTALEPALDTHLERLKDLLDGPDSDAAGEAFFDFRCADIAMGSGHFLVAAADRIEARLAEFYATHELPSVRAELLALRTAAEGHLGEAAPAYEIEDRMLLRRMVARRCIYGVDVNPLAVELARLSLWVHTFVPGLPLSFLDHNLVSGDSLTGIGTVDEAVEYLIGPDAMVGQLNMFDDQIRGWLDKASEPLKRLGRATDSTTADVKSAKEAQKEVEELVGPVRDLFDLICELRRQGELRGFPSGLSNQEISGHPLLEESRARGEGLKAIHFPVQFPEVFLRPQSGFDCLLGNPPWEKVMVETHVFWSLRFPGLRGLSIGRMNSRIADLAAAHPEIAGEFRREESRTKDLRATLLSGPYVGLGNSHPDLVKAFAWRFFALLGGEGRLGMVVPRAVLSDIGNETWRRTVIERGEFTNVVTLLNRKGWAFDQIHQQSSIALVAVQKGRSGDPTVNFVGPFSSLKAFLDGRHDLARVTIEEFQTWTSTVAFPLLPGSNSADVIRKMNIHPRLQESAFGAKFRPVSEFNATNDKKEFILDAADTSGLWPVYSGSSIRLWEPDTGTYYAHCDPSHIVQVLLKKRRAQKKGSTKKADSGLADDTLAPGDQLECFFPRIAYRKITNRTNSRTVICSLVPPEVVMQDGLPYLTRIAGSPKQEAALLGVLSSVPLDWYARRYVELNLLIYIVNSFPIPGEEGTLFNQISSISGRLASPDERFADWAEAVGVEYGPLDDDTKNAMINELDALVAKAYGLDRDDLIHIFETFHEGWDYQPRLDATLEHFDRL